MFGWQFNLVGLIVTELIPAVIGAVVIRWAINRWLGTTIRFGHALIVAFVMSFFDLFIVGTPYSLSSALLLRSTFFGRLIVVVIIIAKFGVPILLLRRFVNLNLKQAVLISLLLYFVEFIFFFYILFPIVLGFVY